MIRDAWILRKEDLFGKYVSLIPATPALKGITLEGFKYPLDRADTAFGESLCVSNELAADEGKTGLRKECMDDFIQGLNI